MSSKIKLILDSRDGQKIAGSTNYVRFNVGDQVRDLTSVNYVQLIEAEIPNTMYQIISSNNTAVFDIYDAGGTVFQRQITVTIPVGHYSLAEFTSALQVQLNLDTATYTVTNDNITDLQTIAITSGETLQFRFDLSTIGRVMGYLDNSTIATSIVSDRQPDLRGITTVLIKSNISDKAVRYSSSSGTDLNTFLGYVPITEAYGSSVFYKNNNSEDIITSVNRIPNTIEIGIVNRENIFVDLNEYEWKIILLIDYNEL